MGSKGEGKRQERISELENRTVNFTQSEQEREID